MSIERWQEPSNALVASEATLGQIARVARTFSRTKLVAECYQNLDGRSEHKEMALQAVGITLVGLGAPFTLQTINQTWVDGGEKAKTQRINLMAQLSMGIANAHGVDCWFEENAYNDQRATISVQRKGSARVDRYTYTVQMARDFGLLDEWVEKREQAGTWPDGNPKYDTVKVVVSIDGQAVAGYDELPEWARKAHAAGQVKRKDPWFRSRVQMLMARAATMGLKVAGAGALLGLDMIDMGPDVPPDREAPHFAPGPGVIDVEPDDGPGEAPADQDTPGVMSQEWAQRLAIGCRELGLNDDQRHALIHHASAGRVSSSKEVRVGEEAEAVRHWFAEIKAGRAEVRQIEDGSWIVASVDQAREEPAA